MAELSTLGAVIKTAYEGEPNTNAYTDAEKTKLAGVAAGATALTIGTTASTAKAGNYVPAWSEVTGKPAVIAAGADAAAARTAIGLGSVATLSSITSANITDGTIVNGDISASASIARTKLAAHGVTAISTADLAPPTDYATDGDAIVALVNELKAKVNSLIGAA